MIRTDVRYETSHLLPLLNITISQYVLNSFSPNIQTNSPDLSSHISLQNTLREFKTFKTFFPFVIILLLLITFYYFL